MSAAAAASIRPRNSPLATEPGHLSLLSYNLLAPVYVRPVDERTGGVQAFAAFEWAEPADQVLNWPARQPRLAAELAQSSADVICLQEVQFEAGEDGAFALPAWLQLEGYEATVPPQRELSNIADRNGRVLRSRVAVGNAMLVRMDRLRRDFAPGAKPKDASRRVGVCVRGREGTALASLGRVALFSVHLDATDEEQRVKQLGRCLELGRAYGTRDVIVAGDMNSECLPGSALASCLADAPAPSNAEVTRELVSALRLGQGEGEGGGEAAADEGAAPAAAAAAEPTAEQRATWLALHQLAASSAADNRVALSRVPTGGTRAAYAHGASTGPCVPWALDHILFSPRALRLVSRWATLEAEPEAAAAGLPNLTCASDHLPVAATFEPVEPASLAEPEKAEVLARVEALRSEHDAEQRELSARLAEELVALEQAEAAAAASAGGGASAAAAEPAEAVAVPEGAGKKRKAKGKGGKGGPPSVAVMALLRSKREQLAEQKARHKAARGAFLGGQGELALDALEDTMGDLAVWRDGR